MIPFSSVQKQAQLICGERSVDVGYPGVGEGRSQLDGGVRKPSLDNPARRSEQGALN